MYAEIKKWGNSLAVRIPKALAEECGLDVGKSVDMRIEDDEIRIKPIRKKRYDLDALLASVPDDYETEDWDIGPPVGNEVW